jgi:hypothetical protein
MADENVTKLRVVKAALRVIDVTLPKADPSYQREVKNRHKRIAGDFREEALGIPLVAERADGSLWIVDGLQRITALRRIGRKQVRAEVFSSNGPEHEAEIFKLVNMERTRLTPVEEFRALLTAHDDAAWKIKEAVERQGYKIMLGKGGTGDASEFYLTCVKTMQKVFKAGGTAPIEFALRMVKESWPGDRLGTYNQVIEGMSLFFIRMKGAVDEDRLLPRLRTVTPQKIIYAAQQSTISNNNATAVADQVEKVYRKRLGSQRRA